MGNPVSKSQEFMEQRERSNTEYRKQGTLSMNLVREEFNRDIQEVYDLRSGELLGKGGFGTVRVVTHKATQNKYALKTIELKDVETVEQYEFLLNEIEIMKQLDHPNIARYKFRSEDETAKIVNKLINALRYCHDRNIAHRDIKLENICFESMADDAEVKLVDFGLSASFKDEQMRHDLVGSWAFMAPEVLQRAHHPQACDLWSMGVITYCLLAGFPPFRSVNLKGLKEQILYSYAKDFIQKLLKKDPQKRWTAQQAQHHAWLTKARSTKKNAKLSPKVVENLMHFKSLNLMKRVALGVVARTLEASEMRNLEQEFHKADIARSGEISIEDFRSVLLRSNQFQRKEVDEIFEGLDIGCSGRLSYTDFTAAALNRQHLDTRRLKYAFERLDHDNNGYLDYEDLMMTVGSDLSTEDVRTAIKQFDTDNRGKVSFE
ncbi:calcium dependent protein kinase 4 [Ectocarpus siliculosus]|uniref:Calcium dependent protein kinase 4 n=1 Tax=Ectocarpus siliculosus TaxID=2880 RepID=D7FK83_ECTSI|nr:calcium dependent protein kinase 4 [Ectocarpus siliculosus]|eukprot:CBJ29288.1 calcium dependent protein kinase 4 [Ectocarpus siliculosus]